MSKPMDDQAWTEFMNSLIIGSIGGMKQVSDGLHSMSPKRFPIADDGHMYDATMLFLASLVDANPDYRDPASFESAADMVREAFLAYLKQVRMGSEAQGKKMLYAQMETALGRPVAANDTPIG